MTDDRQDAAREGDDRRSGGPLGTVLGATLGPFGAAVGGVVDENRLAVTFSVGTGASSGHGDEATTGEREGEATTIEIEDVGSEQSRDPDGGDGEGGGAGRADEDDD